jgi:site-specific recombinase XerD
LESLLAGWDRNTPEGARDLAISLCLARLGLRASEVAGLLLEDSHWRQATVCLEWSKNSTRAQLPKGKDRYCWARRLAIVQRFARFWLAYDPRTEIPEPEWRGPSYRRRAVHIYSRPEIATLLGAAADLGREHLLRGCTFCTLLGLLDCTGLRIGEALGLTNQDIDWSAGVLTITHAKRGHARLIPVQASTHEALGPVRVMRTCGCMGEVVGMAASLCKQHDCTPRAVYQQHLDELKQLITRGVGKRAGETVP